MKNTQQTLELIGVAWFLTALLCSSLEQKSLGCDPLYILQVFLFFYKNTYNKQ